MRIRNLVQPAGWPAGRYGGEAARELRGDRQSVRYGILAGRVMIHGEMRHDAAFSNGDFTMACRPRRWRLPGAVQGPTSDPVARIRAPRSSWSAASARPGIGLATIVAARVGCVAASPAMAAHAGETQLRPDRGLPGRPPQGEGWAGPAHRLGDTMPASAGIAAGGRDERFW